MRLGVISGYRLGAASPRKFFATEQEARAWLDAQRTIHLESTMAKV